MFDKNLYKCKANPLNNKSTIVCGYYYWNVCHFIDVENEDYENKLEYPAASHEINPNSLCRNTGIKIKGGYLYENDLVEYNNGLGILGLGYIEWDDYGKKYSLKTSLNYSSRRDIKGLDIKIIGNIVLKSDDYNTMQKHSDEQDAKYTRISPEPECRSTQHLNKKMREFLPR